MDTVPRDPAWDTKGGVHDGEVIPTALRGVDPLLWLRGVGNVGVALPSVRDSTASRVGITYVDAVAEAKDGLPWTRLGGLREQGA
jgi:hypothetical protein